MTQKLDGWHRKTIGRLFYTTSSFVHYFKPIIEFKLELQSGSAQLRSKSMNFCPAWPWHLMDDLKNNKAPLLCYFKLCASFYSHRGQFKLELQPGNTQCRSKSVIFSPSRVSLKFDGWPCKTIGHIFYGTQSLVHHFIAIGPFKLEEQFGNINSGENQQLYS